MRELSEGVPGDVALSNALAKAAAVLAADPSLEPRTVLGVDTIVVGDDGTIHGKPADENAARATLAALGGRVHRVLGGAAVLRPGAAPQAALASTEVSFRALDEHLLEWYLATGEWRERAGGYAIQRRGALLVEEIRGDYLNVVGLPVAALLELLPELRAPG